MVWLGKCNSINLHHLMKRPKNTYSFSQMTSAIFMMMALLWLTVSIPFVYANPQQQASDPVAKNISPLAGNEEESATPFGNTTEEKAPTNSNSFSEEYLHDNHKSEHYFSIISQFHKSENATDYIAFHGELLVPPPNLV